MAVPVPAPTAVDVVSFSEIALVAAATVTDLVSADSDQEVATEKWLRTLDDIDVWDGGTGTKQTKLKKLGDMEFFEGKAEDARLDLRNRVRTRYGLPPITSETVVQSALTEFASLEWF
jgi:hypothetical protein